MNIDLKLPSGTIQSVLGVGDSLLNEIESRLGVKISARGDDISISVGDPTSFCGDAGPKADMHLRLERIADLFRQMADLSRAGRSFNRAQIRSAIDDIEEGDRPDIGADVDVVVAESFGGKIRPLTSGQRAYVAAIAKNDITFGIGPAGTGKTYLAAASAVTALKTGRVERIVLVRPVVEAGEHLGFLPGDLQEKFDPYVRPLYDDFIDLMRGDRFSRLVSREIVEIAPLAYMRGRTLNGSFIILDEAQNTTKDQMKMFLTRLGQGSKAVITGDPTQVDLPGGKASGLRAIGDILKDVPGIAFCRLTNRDVVRHDIVQRIIKAYEKYERTAQTLAP